MVPQNRPYNFVSNFIRITLHIFVIWSEAAGTIYLYMAQHVGFWLSRTVQYVTLLLSQSLSAL